MSARDAILNQIEDRPYQLPSAINVSPSISGDLWELFVSRLREVGGEIIDRKTVLAFTDKRLWVEKAVEGLLNLKTTCGSIWDAEVGISLAAFGIAETGSLVFEPVPGTERLSSLIPPINVVVVRQLVGTVGEAIARLPAGNVVFTTGTSRTADIEGVLVRGVHGPKELLVYRGR